MGIHFVHTLVFLEQACCPFYKWMYSPSHCILFHEVFDGDYFGSVTELFFLQRIIWYRFIFVCPIRSSTHCTVYYKHIPCWCAFCWLAGYVLYLVDFSGNKLTLETRPSKDGIDIRQELLKFHSTYYSSNLMGLCVLGRGKGVCMVLAGVCLCRTRQHPHM